MGEKLALPLTARQAEKACDRLMLERLQQLAQLRQASRALVQWVDRQKFRRNHIVDQVRELLDTE